MSSRFSIEKNWTILEFWTPFHESADITRVFCQTTSPYISIKLVTSSIEAKDEVAVRDFIWVRNYFVVRVGDTTGSRRSRGVRIAGNTRIIPRLDWLQSRLEFVFGKHRSRLVGPWWVIRSESYQEKGTDWQHQSCLVLDFIGEMSKWRQPQG